MRIAVVSEVSAAARNRDIVAALEGRQHTLINAGMKDADEPELTYIQTGLLAAILLNLKRADLVIGGCGTGQGFLNSVMQYPNVSCGLIQSPLDAWLFVQINGGNCISLALLVNYGWAGDVNLRFIFDRLFAIEEFGKGYPPHRQQSQQESIRKLADISRTTHRPFAEIIASLDDDVVQPVLGYPGVGSLIDVDSIEDEELRRAFADRMPA